MPGRGDLPGQGQLYVPCAGRCLVSGHCWNGGSVGLARLCLASWAHTDPCASWQVQDERPISFPSLLSHITSVHLNAEALVMPVALEKPALPALRSFVPLTTTLPCDFHILNLRMLQAEVSYGPGEVGLWWGSFPCCPQCCASCSSSLQDDSLPSAEAALILHRKGFDCSLEAKNLGFNCTTSQGKVGPGCPHTSTGSELGWDLSMAGMARVRLSWAQCCPRHHILTWASLLLPPLSPAGSGRPVPGAGARLPAAHLTDTDVPAGHSLQQHQHPPGPHGNRHVPHPPGVVSSRRGVEWLDSTGAAPVQQ